MSAFFRRHRVALLHLAFWSAYGSLGWYQYQTEYAARQVAASVLVPLAGYGLLAYFNYFVLLPRWLAHQRLGQYALEFAGPFALVVGGRLWLVPRLLGGSQMQLVYFQKPVYWVTAAAATFFVVLFVGLLRFAQGWFALEARARTLENAQLAAELKLLKAQLNPHFLFNTLNNLYYLAYSGSPNTPEVIAKLAQMMRYMLDEANQRRVPLPQELTYMQNYIALEKLRLNHDIPVELTVAGEPAAGVRVAPLLLITLLENAFKHGVQANAPDAWIRVQLTLAADELACTVENSKLPVPTRPAGAAPAGLGLPNVRRRLELSYPGRHHLAVADLPDRFRVHLTLALTS